LPVPANQGAKARWRWHSSGVAQAVNVASAAIEQLGDLLDGEKRGGRIGM